MVQLAQHGRAFKGLGLELPFRRTLARAKTRRRRQPLGQRPAENPCRVASSQQVGNDQDRDGQDNCQAQP